MADVVKRKVYLTYPNEKVKEGVICEMYDKFQVRFNIRSASVSDAIGIMGLELEGESDKINQAIEFFKDQGVTVEPIEQNIIAG